MAIVTDNDLTRGLRGRVGKWFVFRMVRGKTIASHAPRKPDPLRQSTAQRQTRTTFKEAAAWAVRILLDPANKQYYANLAKAHALPNAYTAAVREYMRGEATKRMEDQLDHSVSANQEANMDEQRRSIPSSPLQHILSPGVSQNAKRHIPHPPEDIYAIHKDIMTIGTDDVWQIHQNLHLSNKDPAFNSNLSAYRVTPPVTERSRSEP